MRRFVVEGDGGRWPWRVIDTELGREVSAWLLFADADEEAEYLEGQGAGPGTDGYQHPMYRDHPWLSWGFSIHDFQAAMANLGSAIVAALPD